MPPKPDASSPKVKEQGRRKGKAKGKSRKRHKLNLKGWLKTADDWARFDAWAKINAQPRKLPEPEPIERAVKPLSQLKKRLVILAIPHAYPDPGHHCRNYLSVSKAALKAKASKRIKQLALFIWHEEDYGREFPLPISPAALKYQATERIVEIGKPKISEPEECRSMEISEKALKHKTSAREAKMSLAKKAIVCPNSLTDEEREKLMTPTGIKRSALSYKITEWMLILALPVYRRLKDRRDPDAKEWKKKLMESEERGKKALEEQKRREEEKEKKNGKKGKNDKTRRADGDTNAAGGEGMTERKGDEKEEPEEKNEETKKKEEEAKRKKEERNAWRKEPSPCKDAFSISKAAMKAKASQRTEELAKPHLHENQSCRENVFSVSQAALKGKASSRTEEMAKPNRPMDPVERAPPREKDKYGRPIFPKPKYGKILPTVKPYRMGLCRDKNEEEKRKPKRRKRVDPVALFPSIDPCVDPDGARRQVKARKAAKEARRKRKARNKQAQGDENEGGAEKHQTSQEISKRQNPGKESGQEKDSEIHMGESQREESEREDRKGESERNEDMKGKDPLEGTAEEGDGNTDATGGEE